MAISTGTRGRRSQRTPASRYPQPQPRNRLKPNVLQEGGTRARPGRTPYASLMHGAWGRLEEEVQAPVRRRRAASRRGKRLVARGRAGRSASARTPGRRTAASSRRASPGTRRRAGTTSRASAATARGASRSAGLSRATGRSGLSARTGNGRTRRAPARRTVARRTPARLQRRSSSGARRAPASRRR